MQRRRQRASGAAATAAAAASRNGASLQLAALLVLAAAALVAHAYPVVRVYDEASLNEDTSYNGSIWIWNHLPTQCYLINSTTHGLLVLNGTSRNFTYTPDPDYYGTDAFHYWCNDLVLNINSSFAKFQFNVANVNDRPVVTPLNFSIYEDQLLNITLNGTDIDNPQADFTYAVSGLPSGSAVINFNTTSGRLTFRPKLDSTSDVQFFYTLSDKALTSVSQRIFISVTSVNDPPVVLHTPQVTHRQYPSYYLKSWSVNDVDAGINQIDCRISSETGSLYINPQDVPVLITKATNNLYVLEGGFSALEVALNNLVYSANTSDIRTDKISVQIKDRGFTGTLGGEQVVVVNVTIPPSGSVFTAHPSNGPFRGGNRVTITGTNFGNGTDVTGVWLADVKASAIHEQTSTYLVVTAGDSRLYRPNGQVRVLSENLGFSAGTNLYTYNREGLISSVWPTAGPRVGGYNVTITGANLGNSTDIYFVALAGRNVTNLLVQSQTQLIVEVPSCPQDTCNVGFGAIDLLSINFGNTSLLNGWRYWQDDERSCKRFDVCLECAIHGNCTECPEATPIRCPSGHCTTDESLCTVQEICPAATPIRCHDRTCVNTPHSCRKLECPEPMYQCADGSCQSSRFACDALDSCGSLVRCENGKCAASLTACGTNFEYCNGTQQRCADGTCRLVCPTYFGCPYGYTLCNDSRCIDTSVPGASCRFDCPTGFVRCVSGQCSNTTCESPVWLRQFDPLDLSLYENSHLSVALRDRADRTIVARVHVSNTSHDVLDSTAGGVLSLLPVPHSEVRRLQAPIGRDGVGWSAVLSAVVQVGSLGLNETFESELMIDFLSNHVTGLIAKIELSDICLGRVDIFSRWICESYGVSFTPSSRTGRGRALSASAFLRVSVTRPGIYALIQRDIPAAEAAAEIPTMAIGLAVLSAAVVAAVAAIGVVMHRKRSALLDQIRYRRVNEEKAIPSRAKARPAAGDGHVLTVKTSHDDSARPGAATSSSPGAASAHSPSPLRHSPSGLSHSSDEASAAAAAEAAQRLDDMNEVRRSIAVVEESLRLRQRAAQLAAAGPTGLGAGLTSPGLPPRPAGPPRTLSVSPSGTSLDLLDTPEPLGSPSLFGSAHASHAASSAAASAAAKRTASSAHVGR